MRNLMTRDELLELHRSITEKARTTMEAKNRDYAGGGTDIFANFRACEALGVNPVIGILMRCIDKFQRIRAFVTTGRLAVVGEPVDDAVQDVVNYMILIQGLIVEERMNMTEQMEFLRQQPPMAVINEGDLAMGDPFHCRGEARPANDGKEVQP